MPLQSPVSDSGWGHGHTRTATPDLSLSGSRATVMGEGMAVTADLILCQQHSALRGMIAGTKTNKPSSATPTSAETWESFNPKKPPSRLPHQRPKLAEDHQKDVHLLPRPEGWACLGLLCSSSLASRGRTVSQRCHPKPEGSRGRWWEQETSTGCASLHLFHIQVLFYGYE